METSPPLSLMYIWLTDIHLEHLYLNIYIYIIPFDVLSVNVGHVLHLMLKVHAWNIPAVKASTYFLKVCSKWISVNLPKKTIIMKQLPRTHDDH